MVYVHQSQMDSTTKHIPQCKQGASELGVQEDEELFDIDLELVDHIPPPNYCWESYILSTRNVLLANCLLPATRLSSAVPVLSGELDQHMLSISVLRLPAGSIAKMQMLEVAEEFPSLHTLQSKENNCSNAISLPVSSFWF